MTRCLSSHVATWTSRSFAIRSVGPLLLTVLLLAAVLPVAHAQSGAVRPNSGATAANQTRPAVTAPAPQPAPDGLVAPPVDLAAGGGLHPQNLLSPDGLTPTLKVMLLLTLLSLAPSILVMTSCFIRFVIVLGLLRQALGTQQLPPTQIITSLSLFLTIFVMLPVWEQAWEEGIAPYVDQRPIPGLQENEDTLKRVLINTLQPVRRFMSEQIHRSGGDDVVWMLLDYRRPHPDSLAAETWVEPQTLDEVETPVIVTAYMLSELKTAFMIGFQVYLPFLVIDMVVSTILTGMGMVMLPPTLISLPFKLLLFVLIDGWSLTVDMLLRSVTTLSG